MIDKYTGQLFADRPVDQCRDDRGVHAAGQPEQDLAVPDLAADVGDRLVDEFLHRPASGAAALTAEGHGGVDVSGFEARNQVEHRQAERLEFLPRVGAFRRFGVGAEDQADRLLRRHPLRRNGIRHHHGVDVAVADRPGEFLDVTASEIDQDNGFRCLLHGVPPGVAFKKTGRRSDKPAR
ncbi:hypothetical protein SDC9_108874 [bioreactor metagenome]|uniref:Uncharacterized protein n=1 Tax=bioreactor metagenome TaxID=1076179 RepID=A0A645B948_9ZZZZ